MSGARITAPSGAVSARYDVPVGLCIRVLANEAQPQECISNRPDPQSGRRQKPRSGDERGFQVTTGRARRTQGLARPLPPAICWQLPSVTGPGC